MVQNEGDTAQAEDDAARYARLDAARQRQQEENDLAASRYVATTGNDNEDDGA
jgi:hypothetical protein